jgi:hypothetical protein
LYGKKRQKIPPPPKKKKTFETLQPHSSQSESDCSETLTFFNPANFKQLILQIVEFFFEAHRST